MTHRTPYVLFLGVLLALLFSPLAMAEPIGYTVPCSESQAFKELQATRFSGIDAQIEAAKQINPSSAYIEQLNQSKALWERRYATYEKNANCDKVSGYPHLITDGRWSHAGDFIIPSLLWIYLTGALAWAGRDYLLKTQNPMDEILIDLGKAFPSLLNGLLWPVQAIPQLISGQIRDEKVKP